MKSKFFLTRIFIFFIAFFFSTSFAGNLLIQNNYKVLTPQDAPKDFVAPKGKILVMEFFSPGCPHCAHLESFIEKWQEQNKAFIFLGSTTSKIANNKQHLIFRKVPVTFEKDWNYYAQALYIAAKLGLSKSLDPEIFTVAQNNFLGLHSDAQVRSFFITRGVSQAAFDRVVKDPTIQLDMQSDQKLMHDFKIFAIPTVVVVRDGKFYMVSNATVSHGDPQIFIDTLTSLTAKKLELS